MSEAAESFVPAFLLSCFHFLERGGCGPARHEREDFDLSADLTQRGEFIGMQTLDCVVAAFRVNLRADGAQNLRHAHIRKNGDVIDTTERAQNLRAILLAIDRASGAFQRAHGGVAIERDEQCVAELPGLLQIADMPGVQEIETAVGKNHPSVRGGKFVAYECEFGGGFQFRQ